MTAATTYREGCGTVRGLRLHQAAGERPCSECARGEALRLLELERIPTRPPRDAFGFPPITPAQAAAHRRVLADAIGALDPHPEGLAA